MLKDHNIKYIMGIIITCTIRENIYISHIFFKPSHLQDELKPERFKGCDNDIPTQLPGE